MSHKCSETVSWRHDTVSINKCGGLFWLGGDEVFDCLKICDRRFLNLSEPGCCVHGHRQRAQTAPYLGMVMHFVLIFWVVMAFSSSSSCPVFFSFFTRLLTAFSHHFSSWPFCSPFFHPKSRLTIGGVKGKIDILS